MLGVAAGGAFAATTVGVVRASMGGNPDKSAGGGDILSGMASCAISVWSGAAWGMIGAA